MNELRSNMSVNNPLPGCLRSLLSRLSRPPQDARVGHLDSFVSVRSVVARQPML